MIERWFADPETNVGIVITPGMFVIDIDGNRGIEHWNRLTRKRGRASAATLMAESGGGGWHLLYRGRASPTSSLDGLDGVEVRTAGQGLMVEPSRHPDGGLYRWCSGVTHSRILPPPRWLAGKVWQPGREPPRQGKGVRVVQHRTGDPDVLAESLIDKYPITRRGERNAQLMRSAYYLAGQGFVLDDAEGALLAWSDHFYRAGTTKDPPNAKTARSAYRGPLERGRVFRARNTNHTQETLQIEPSDEQSKALHLLANTRSRIVSSNTVVTLQAILAHCTYELRRRPDEPVKLTDAQIRGLVKALGGPELAPPQIERFKARYVSRPDRPASKIELLRQVHKGGFGKGPSEYAVTGLAAVIQLGQEGR